MDEKFPRVGANIKALRLYYNETQEELGAVFDYGKIRINNYENGRWEPELNTLEKIANHYRISVDELKYKDFSYLYELNSDIDYSILLKNFSIILPIVYTEEAMNNKHFKKAYMYHNAFYEALSKLTVDINIHDYFLNPYKNFMLCSEEYDKAGENEDIKIEVQVNLIAISFLFISAYLIIKTDMHNLSAILDDRLKKIPNPQELDIYISLIMGEIVKMFQDTSITEIIDKLYESITEVKHSGKWGNIADYYFSIAHILKSILDDVQIKHDFSFGLGMLCAYSSVGNVYAINVLNLLNEIIG